MSTDYDYHRHSSAYALAELAGVNSPDNNNSPGAAFLVAVRNAFYDAADAEEFEGTYPEDRVSELAATTDAGGVVTIWTHDQWSTFTDLALYHSEHFEEVEPGVNSAQYTLALVSYDLMSSLLDYYRDHMEDKALGYLDDEE